MHGIQHGKAATPKRSDVTHGAEPYAMFVAGLADQQIWFDQLHARFSSCDLRKRMGEREDRGARRVGHGRRQVG